MLEILNKISVKDVYWTTQPSENIEQNYVCDWEESYLVKKNSELKEKSAGVVSLLKLELKVLRVLKFKL
jgi:hypothetical protein